MIRRLGLAAVLLAVPLAACGNGGTEEDRTVHTPDGTIQTQTEGENSTSTYRGEDGREVVVATGPDVAASGPAYTRPYPDSRVLSSVTSPTDNAGLLTFQTEAEPGTVIAYYRQRAEESGLTARAEMTMGDTQQFGADTAAGGEFNVVVTPQDGQSTVTVTWEGLPG